MAISRTTETIEELARWLKAGDRRDPDRNNEDRDAAEARYQQALRRSRKAKEGK